MVEEQARQRLADEMDQRRLELRVHWTEVARRAGMTPQNLLRIRNNDISISWEASDGIEDALRWERGSIEAILAGRQPTPLVTRREIGPEPEAPADEDDGWTDEDESLYQALTELLRRQGLKPTPAIIQAMREEWEREHAERDVSDETG